MKETGIMMSGDHPQKVIDGRKTMTRRTQGLDKIQALTEVRGYLNAYMGLIFYSRTIFSGPVDLKDVESNQRFIQYEMEDPDTLSPRTPQEDVILA